MTCGRASSNSSSGHLPLHPGEEPDERRSGRGRLDRLDVPAGDGDHRRSAVKRSSEYAALSVSDSPGQSEVSLPLQRTGSTSLSPESGSPAASPRRTSARRKNATDGVCEVFVTVTEVTRVPPTLAPDVEAVTEIVALGRSWSPVKSAYWDIVACGFSTVAFQLTMSGCVESQYTLRSMTEPFWRSTSSTKKVWAGSAARSPPEAGA